VAMLHNTIPWPVTGLIMSIPKGSNDGVRIIRFLYLIQCLLFYKQDNNAVKSGVFTAVTMKNPVFWDITPCGS
jgi:hypothetical protein